MMTLEQFLKKGTCAATVVKTAEEELADHGFTQLKLSQPWELKQGGAYFVNIRGTSLIAFRVGDTRELHGVPYFRIVSSHTDQPCLKLKCEPEVGCGASGKLNVSVYGGPIYYSWLDRPLSLAGQVVLGGSGTFDNQTVVVDLHRPLLVIPSLAIHMNRDVNNGIALNPQVDLQPLAGLDLEKDWLKDLLVEYLQMEEHLQVKKEDILHFELYTYNMDEPMRTGVHEEFLSAPRIDDLCMAKAALDAIITTQENTGVTVAAFLDNEEIGSRTPQGGESVMTSFVLEKIASALGLDRSSFVDALTDSYMISSDVAHAVHPNHPEKHDSSIFPVLGGGPVIKEDASQRYLTNVTDEGVVISLCEKNKIPYQFFISRADMRSGTTLGPVMCANLPCRGMDLGTPMLSMHSARELMAVADFESTRRLFECFYQAQI